MNTPSASEALTQSLGSLSMAEMVRLQDFISQELRRRFEKQLAVGFSDVVGSTAYFARFGDEAGRRIQQRHFDLLAESILPRGGRIVDTAGDGAFMVFPDVRTAAESFIAFEHARCADNATRPHDQRLEVRMAIHCGSVLTDGVHVTGDAVNLAARVSASAGPGEIHLTREAFVEIPPSRRLVCQSLGAVELKGISRPVETYRLDWHDRSAFPERLRVRETGEQIDLPPLDTIRFGRLVEHDGVPANEIVLKLPSEQQTRKISRWHFELRRYPDGIRLRPVSDQLTEVDGQMVARGVEVPVRTGTLVCVGRVLTLEFAGRPESSLSTAGNATVGVSL